MSELTKEKIYKKELIAGGATGNNNLERIRSLAGGSGGNKKYIVEKIGEDNGKRRIDFTTLAVSNNIFSFGGAKYDPRFTQTYELVAYNRESNQFSTRNIFGQVTVNPVIIEFGGMFLFVANNANNYNQLMIKALPVSEMYGDTFADFYSVDNFVDYDIKYAFIDGWKMYILDSGYNLYSINIEVDVTNKTISFTNPTKLTYYEGEKPTQSVIVDSYKIGVKIYVLISVGNQFELYSFNLITSTWEKETTLQLGENISIPEKNGCFIGNDYYFISRDIVQNKTLYKFNLLTFETTKLDIEGDYPFDAQLFNYDGEIGIAGGTGSNVHFVISKLTPKP